MKKAVIGMQKGNETFLFYYDPQDREGLVRTIARFAANPELNLTWSDAALLIRDAFPHEDGIYLELVSSSAGASTPCGWIALAVFPETCRA
jgi:hypothetical protein